MATRPKEFLAWAVGVFGSTATLRDERAMRFVEEAVELAQAEGVDEETMRRNVARVYARRPGSTAKEIGQAQATLEMLAENIGLSAAGAADREFARAQAIPAEEWARRHAAKAEIGIARPSCKASPDLVERTIDARARAQAWRL